MLSYFAALPVVLVSLTGMPPLHDNLSGPQSAIIETCDETPHSDLYMAQVVRPGDDVRGCCVLNTTPASCVSANRGYCRNLANKNNAKFDFYPGSKCADVAQCPKPE